MIENRSSRILALDVLRGITIAGMILVNNPGSWSYVYPPLRHADWHGLTPTDLVFPFFMFIMGFSIYISLRKFNFSPTAPTIKKILKRTVLLYLVGLGIAWFSLTMRTYNGLSTEELSFFSRIGQSMWNFDRIRILGVIPRLALAYGISSLIVITLNHKHIPLLVASSLIGYFILLLAGNGFIYDTTNILSKVDMRILGVNHMYNDNGIDPEGILSTIPSIAHVLLGFFIGKVTMEANDLKQKVLLLLILGTVLTASGVLFSFGCPINKKIWSPTFVLIATGLAVLLLALLIWIIDLKDKKKGTLFFEVYGINPLFMYVFAAITTILLGNIQVYPNGVKMALKSYLFEHGLQPVFGNYPGSLLYALLFVALNWMVGYILYKKKIYIKL